MKKVLSLLLAVMMVITMLPVAAFADELELFPVGEAPFAEAPAKEEKSAEELAETEQSMAILKQPLGAEKSASIPKITKIAFEGYPAFDSSILFYNQPEGTVFQLDETGNHTDKTGISNNCYNYTVYVNKGTKTVKVAGSSGIKVKNNFAYTPDKDGDNKAYASKVYVIENGKNNTRLKTMAYI